MKPMLLRLYRNFGFSFLSVVLVAVGILSYLTWKFRDTSPASPLYQWAIINHVWINFILVIIAISFGFVWSHISFHEIQQREKQSRKVIDVVMLFLSTDERAILNYLVEKKGEASQADVSRLEGMNRVKAFRTLQKMQQRNLLEITSFGKVRKVRLKENIYDSLVG